jgi:uncharacterized protein (TIGR03437 family)
MRVKPAGPVVCLLFLCVACTAQQYTISTIAGAPPASGSTAPVLPALVNYWAGASIPAPGNLSGIAADAAGNLYFSAEESIFRLTAQGVQTRIAGTSRAGYSGDGGLAVNAQLNRPGGLVVDPSGNVYIADNGNYRVRRVDTNGIVTTIAGNGVYDWSGDGGPATEAAMKLSIFPFGGPLAMDTEGNLYIGDTGNERVRKVTPAGIISTVARVIAPPESAPGVEVDLDYFWPGALAVDANGNLFIAELAYNTVWELSASGQLTFLTGGGGTAATLSACPGAQPTFYQISLALDSGGSLIYGGGCLVKKYSAGGTITTLAGNGTSGDSGDGGPAAAASMATVLGLAFDGAGNLFVASTGIRKIAAKTGTITTVVGTSGALHFAGDSGPASAAVLYNPALEVLDKAGNLYFVDTSNIRVRKIAPNGTITTVAGNGMSGTAGNGDGGPAIGAALVGPTGLAVDGAGNLFVADTAVRKVAANGTITTVAGGSGIYCVSVGRNGAPAGSVSIHATGVAVDSSGNVYIADAPPFIGFACLDKVTPDGTLTTIVAGPCCTGPGMALDAQGNIWVVNQLDVVMVSQQGLVTKVAGGAFNDAGFSGDGGPAQNATMNNPWGIALDSAGNLYISDVNNYRIRKVTTGGIIQTIAGQGAVGAGTSAAYSGDGGPATMASLGGNGVAVDQAGNVYVADGPNNAIRVLKPVNQSTIISAVLDAASQTAIAVSPGKIVTIYGVGLGPAQLVQTQPVNGQYGAQLATTTVTFNGTPAPLLYTYATQVAAIVPYEIVGPTAQVMVTYQGAVSAPFSVAVASTAPSFFSLNGTGAGQIAAVNAADGSINDAAHSVAVGGYISLFATGEGITTPAGTDGALAATTPFPHPVAPVQLTIGGVNVTPAYAGAAPEEVEGLMQIVAQIPAGVAAGGYIPVTLQVGAATTTAGSAWIAVGNQK